MATDDGSALSLWNLGLRSKARMLPITQITPTAVMEDTRAVRESHSTAVVGPQVQLACGNIDILQQAVDEAGIVEKASDTDTLASYTHTDQHCSSSTLL